MAAKASPLARRYFAAAKNRESTILGMAARAMSEEMGDPTGEMVKPGMIAAARRHYEAAEWEFEKRARERDGNATIDRSNILREKRLRDRSTLPNTVGINAQPAL